MAALNFPASPEVDDVYTANGLSWRWTGVVWTPVINNIPKVYTITDGPSVVLNPIQGSIQIWTLGDNRTPTANFTAGYTMRLMVADGASAYAITWTSVAPIWIGGSQPTLPTSGYAVIDLWKVDTTIYGFTLGNVV